MNRVNQGFLGSVERRANLDCLVLKVNLDHQGIHRQDLVQDEMVWMVYQESLDRRVNQDKKGNLG